MRDFLSNGKICSVFVKKIEINEKIGFKMISLVSVIVPVYNVEKYLCKCVDTILNQTYTNLEVILVDDGSTDTSANICDEYAQKDRRVIVIHKKNGGLSDARNAGIEIAKGEYILFVDSDDYIALDMVNVFIDRMLHDNSQMAICNHYHLNDNDESIAKFNRYLPVKDCVKTNLETMACPYKYKGSTYIHACNKMYKKMLFDSVRYPKGKIHEDEFIIHRLFFLCATVSHVSKPMYYHIHRQGSIMSTNIRWQRFDAIESRLDRMDFYLQHQLETLYSNGFVDFLRKYCIYFVVMKKTDESNKRFIELKNNAKEIYQKKCGSFSLTAKIKHRLFLLHPLFFVITDLRSMKECALNFKMSVVREKD